MEKPADYLRIKVALDTQILAYLIDNTYPNITKFIKKLSESPFVDLVCSRFAIYEFIGIRKLEHYLRCLVDHTTKNGGKLNLSSAIKFKSEFEAPELKYLDTFEKVKEEVEKELSFIYNNFGVEYEKVNIHNNVWKPHQDLVLSTKISKEDSLLMLSCIFPDILQREKYIILLTNDNQFHQSLCGGEKEIELSDKIFKENNLERPHLYHLKKFKLNTDETLNLTENDITDERLEAFTKKFIFEHIKEKNKDYYLGKIVACPTNLRGKLMCFQLQADKLIDNIYVTVLSEDLDSVYNYTNKLTNFHNINKIETYPYIPDENIDTSRNISVEVFKDDKERVHLEADEYNKISKVGSFVFIHPDSFI